MSTAMQNTTASLKRLLYIVPSLLFFLAPLLAPQYHYPQDVYVYNMLQIFTIVGLICSILWLRQAKKLSAKIGVGVVIGWYFMFSVLIIGTYIRGNIEL